MSSHDWTGGCQCGAVRFSAGSLTRPVICHCRMCQKAFGGIGGVLVICGEFAWTRGTPKYFASSNLGRRGFCAACGTPLTFESDGGIEVAVATFDRAAEIAPTGQTARHARLPWSDTLAGLPDLPAEEAAEEVAFSAGVVSNQHPDHDTSEWPVARKAP